MKPAPGLHLSSSSIINFLACPRKFYYTKLLDIRSESGTAAARGSAFHTAMQTFHAPETERRWRENGEDVRAVYDECCEGALRNYLALVDGQLEKRQEEDLLRKLFRNYGSEQDRWPHLRTLATEAQFEWTVDGVTVLGYIDRIIASDVGAGGVEIVDYKTGSDKTKNAIQAQLGINADHPPSDLQLLIYFFALEEGANVRHRDEWVSHRHEVAAISLWYPKRVLGKNAEQHIRKVGLGDGPSHLDGEIEFIDIHAQRGELREMVADVFAESLNGEYAARPKHDQYTCTSAWGTGCDFAWLCPGRVEEPVGYEADG